MKSRKFPPPPPFTIAGKHKAFKGGRPYGFQTHAFPARSMHCDANLRVKRRQLQIPETKVTCCCLDNIRPGLGLKSLALSKAPQKRLHINVVLPLAVLLTQIMWGETCITSVSQR